MDGDHTLSREEIVQGDPDVWEAVVTQHYDRVMQRALACVRRRSLAEDIAQETFLRAFQKRHLFDGSGSLAGWLSRIVVNLSRDMLRYEGIRQHADLSVLDSRLSGDPQPPDLAHRDHCSRVLNDALREMDAPMRQAFEDTIVMGYSYKEAAQRAGVSPGTIASRVARTRDRLARKCSELEL